MPRRDIYHDAVKTSLIKAGWVITDDPLTVPTPGLDFHIDLGAVREMIGAEKDGRKIAVEIKSLKGNSVFYDFHQALGQYLIYRLALKIAQKSHSIFLAIPQNEFKRLDKTAIYRTSWQEYGVNLLIFDEHKQEIIEWISN